MDIKQRIQAANEEAARRLTLGDPVLVDIAPAGETRLDPNHPHGAVGPMAGTISPAAPVWVIENRAFGNRAVCRQVEGRQQFGDYSPEALESLRRWRDVWAPTL